MDDEAEARALLDRWGVKRGLTEKQFSMNVLWTCLLDGGLLLLLAFLLLLGTEILSLQSLHCDSDPTCAGRITTASTVLVAGLFGVFAVTVGASVVLLVRRKLAFYIPIVGGLVMIGCIAITSVIGGQPV